MNTAKPEDLPGTDKTISIDLPPMEEMASHDPLSVESNMILVHRTWSRFGQWWGNTCSKIVTKLFLYADQGKKIRWYHTMIYNFCYHQYDTYGDYYRVIDNTYGKSEHDDIYEVV